MTKISRSQNNPLNMIGRSDEMSRNIMFISHLDKMCANFKIGQQSADQLPQHQVAINGILIMIGGLTK
jgi:hypothetical protein